MSAQVTITTTDGRILVGISYRMSPPPVPAVPASPNGGWYHIEQKNGWIDIPADQVQSIVLAEGTPT